MHGCPCTRLSSWSRLASCDECRLVYPLNTLLSRWDGKLIRVPCGKIKEYSHVLQAGFEPAKPKARDLKSPPVDQARELQCQR